jgi:protein-L-isoaspartate(D-aspartate) O-methyltransferase
VAAGVSTVSHLPAVGRFAAVMVFTFFSRDHAAAADSDYAAQRERMVSEQIEARGVRDERVLASFRATPRHLFVPTDERAHAYNDYPLPIGEGQTISQPYIVALMTELARPRATDRALEIGTGSGYQAAVLAPLVAHVYTIELEPSLARTAEAILRELKYENVTTRTGDGYAGWPDEAPFDIIIVTAAPDHVPQPLLDQLKVGGRLVVPVGPLYSTQELQVIEKDAAGRLKTRNVTPVRFVPLRRSP